MEDLKCKCVSCRLTNIVIGLVVFVSLVIFLAITHELIPSKPSFKKDDCISQTAKLESWEKRDLLIKKVLNVGKNNYLVIYNTFYNQALSENLSFEEAKEYEKINCPPDMKDL